MGQKDGEKWAAAAVSQPTIRKPDRLLGRLKFVLRRLGRLVARARLRLSDINGPRGGVDKQCQVELKTDGGDNVVITAASHDWRTAIDDALARAAQVLRRQLNRSRPDRGARTSRTAARPIGLPAPERDR